MNRRLVHRCATVAVASVLWGCAATGVTVSEAEALYAQEDYFQAYQAITRARAAAPDDPVVERSYWKIRQAYLLKEAQQLVFRNREPEALELLEKVLALDAENAIALRWRAKALSKLAERSIAAGEDEVAAGELQLALSHFNDALRYEPGNAAAVEGLERLGERWKEFQDEARGHFVSGLRALGDHAYDRTRYHLDIAIEKDPTLTEARDPADVAKRQIVDARFAEARKLENDGYFGAALREYDDLAKIAPELDGIEDRRARAASELEVSELALKGELAIYRGEYEAARELLTQAFAETTRQQDTIGDLLLLARERELEGRYLAAKDLELQRRLDDSLAALQAVEEDAPGYRDVRARIADLRLRIDEAQKAYAAGVEAEAAGDLDAAIEQLVDVQLFWQGYRDSRERLARLREQRRARDAGEATAAPDKS